MNAPAGLPQGVIDDLGDPLFLDGLAQFLLFEQAILVYTGAGTRAFT